MTLNSVMAVILLYSACRIR